MCVCGVNWNLAHVLVASGQRHIDSMQRFTVHNNISCNKTSCMVQTDTHDKCVHVTLHVLEKQSDGERDEEICRLVGVSV